jgi:heat shock protein HslJ
VRALIPASIALIVAFAGASCVSTTNEPSPGNLDGRRWRLVELGGRPAVGTGTSREAHLVFTTDSARVGGATGCNHLSGQFTLSGDSLRFGPAITTKMACLDTAVMRQEHDFVVALDSTRGYQIAGDTLTFLGSSGALARFVGVAATQAPDSAR